MSTITLRSKNRALAQQAIKLLTAEKPMTLRQLYYRLISAGALDNKQTEYQRLGGLMTRIREAGDVPRNWLVDHTRATLKPSSWSGLVDFADTVRHAYRKDFWARMPHYVAILVEKDAVAGTIQPITNKYDVSLHVCRGYSSVSFAGEIADMWQRIEKPIFAYYLGDFDPSGFDLERDLREKLTRYSGMKAHVRDIDEQFAVAQCAFSWVRLGITIYDFDEHGLIRLPVKKTDKRASGFVDTWGEDCAEVDAIPPSDLRQRIEDAILGHIDADRWNRLVTVEKAEQETLAHFVGSLSDGGADDEI